MEENECEKKKDMVSLLYINTMWHRRDSKELGYDDGLYHSMIDGDYDCSIILDRCFMSLDDIYWRRRLSTFGKSCEES